MNLYLANGRYVGTQAEARKIDRGFRPVTVPVDKDGLIGYLNALRSASSIATAVQRPQADYSPEAVERNGGFPASCDMSATASLSRMNNPSMDVDGIVEAIMTAKDYALKRFAGAVAVAFKNLSGGK